MMRMQPTLTRAAIAAQIHEGAAPLITSIDDVPHARWQSLSPAAGIGLGANRVLRIFRHACAIRGAFRGAALGANRVRLRRARSKTLVTFLGTQSFTYRLMAIQKLVQYQLECFLKFHMTLLSTRRHCLRLF